MRHISDSTGRFAQRPFWREAELDRECEIIVTSFLRRLHDKVEYPIGTEDLKTLVEEEVQDLDQYADLSGYGADVEGVTVFEPGRKPKVRIAAQLAEDDQRENRLRTTLTHEYGHVRFHGYLFEAEPRTADLFEPGRARPQVVSCKRDRMINAPKMDWMEWQAGHICGAILMPASAARRTVAAIQERSGVFGPVATATPAGSALVKAVAAQFQVSLEAARVRLTRLGHLGAQASAVPLFGVR